MHSVVAGPLKVFPSLKRPTLEVIVDDASLAHVPTSGDEKDPNALIQKLIDNQILQPKHFTDLLSAVRLPNKNKFPANDIEGTSDERSQYFRPDEHLRITRTQRILNQFQDVFFRSHDRDRFLPKIVNVLLRVKSEEGAVVVERGLLSPEVVLSTFHQVFEKRCKFYERTGVSKPAIEKWKEKVLGEVSDYSTALTQYKRGRRILDIAIELERAPRVISSWIKGSKLPRSLFWLSYEAPATRVVKIPRDESPEFAYLLGVYASSDRGVKRGFKLQSQDLDAVRKVKEAIHEVFGINIEIKKKEIGTLGNERPTYQIFFQSKTLLNYLAKATLQNSRIPWEHVVTASERKAYLQGILDFNSSVTSGSNTHRGEKRSHACVEIGLLKREAFREDLQVLFKMNGIYPLCGGGGALQIKGKTDLLALKEVGFNASRKEKKLEEELIKGSHRKTEYGPQQYVQVIALAKSGMGDTAISRITKVGRDLILSWRLERSVPERVKRYRAICEIEARKENPDCIGFLCREWEINPFLARTIAKKVSFEELPEKSEQLRAKGIDPRVNPKALLSGFEKFLIDPDADGAPVISSDLESYIASIKQFPILTKSEQRSLVASAQMGDLSARNKVITSNLLFVVHVARKFEGGGVSLMDLVLEGNTGLMHAVDKFNLERKGRDGNLISFTGYAKLWIIQRIRKAILESELVHIPEYLKRAHKKYKAAQAELARIKKTTPTREEIVQHLGWARGKAENVEAATKLAAAERVDENFVAAGGADENLSKAALRTTRDRLLLKRNISLAFDALGIKGETRKVLFMKYGLGKHNLPYSNEEIGKALGMTTMKVHVIAENAKEAFRINNRVLAVRRLMHYFEQMRTSTANL